MRYFNTPYRICRLRTGLNERAWTSNIRARWADCSIWEYNPFELPLVLSHLMSPIRYYRLSSVLVFTSPEPFLTCLSIISNPLGHVLGLPLTVYPPYFQALNLPKLRYPSESNSNPEALADYRNWDLLPPSSKTKFIWRIQSGALNYAVRKLLTVPCFKRFMICLNSGWPNL